MSTSFAQDLAHRTNISLAEGARQTAIATAKLTYGNPPSPWAAFDAAIRAADVAYVRAIIASSAINGLGSGPTGTLHDLTGLSS
jgi:hypothetical protein